MPAGSVPNTDSVSPAGWFQLRMVIVADAMVVASASVIDTSTSAIGVPGPVPVVN